MRAELPLASGGCYVGAAAAAGAAQSAEAAPCPRSALGGLCCRDAAAIPSEKEINVDEKLTEPGLGAFQAAPCRDHSQRKMNTTEF
ncbi:hypothetical protein DV515_00008543 [Chloebia gouldiae]|uniref:Uncharacterized protein n=1 Tax=Chloebia gouldiae TaxID=44316 RepID=A0A3L8SER2_CHLGU|nr:hypothetical protein DV515_00008543 [Chloebia gouldiae]